MERGGREAGPLHSSSQQAPPALPYPPSAMESATSGLAPIAQDASWPTVATVPWCALPVSGTQASELWGPEGRQQEPRFAQLVTVSHLVVADSWPRLPWPQGRQPSPGAPGLQRKSPTDEQPQARSGSWLFPHLVLCLKPGRMALDECGGGGVCPVPSCPTCAVRSQNSCPRERSCHRLETLELLGCRPFGICSW